MALSRPKLAQDNAAKDNRPIESIENRYNLANIFRKLKELRNADTIETEKRKESHSSHEKQPKLAKFEQTLSDKALYAEKASEKCRAMRNGFKVCTSSSKQGREML